MSKLKIADAAIKLGVSKEAIHNRIRRGSLDCVVEDGIKYVILKPSTKTASMATKRRVTNNTPKSSLHVDSKYYKFLEEQNEKLQHKVEKLEGETRDLRDQKEQMLISEREKIEQIYKDKDEQLKNILNAISSNFLLNTPATESEISEPVEVEIEAQESSSAKLISLKKYLNNQDISNKKKKKIKDKFKKIAKEDNRVIRVGKKLYLDLAKFDYSDLF